jgi:hypothetical protein
MWKRRVSRAVKMVQVVIVRFVRLGALEADVKSLAIRMHDVCLCRLSWLYYEKALYHWHILFTSVFNRVCFE